MGEQDRPGAARTQVLEILERLSGRPGTLLVVLHEVQNLLGFIPRECVPQIAAALNLSRAEVHGVISFYRDFRTELNGRHEIRVCRAESCQAMGGAALVEHARARLGIEFGETTADRQFTLKSVYCLGNCACSPSVMLDRQVHGRVTPAVFDELIGQFGLR